MASTSPFTHSTVHTESCTLHYYHIGQGPQLFTFIPGGNGHGKQYDVLMTQLALDTDSNGKYKYTCVTYDRRQMSGSMVDGGAVNNKKMDLEQQGRDVGAVIEAMGHKNSLIFANSLGGAIGLQLAASHPGYITHLISHEAPLHTLLPDSAEMDTYLHNCFKTYKEGGVEATWSVFVLQNMDLSAEGLPLPIDNGMENKVNFWEFEFEGLMDGSWDFEEILKRVKDNGVSVGLMEGKRSEGASYARSVDEQQKRLGCLKWVVPGHHQGFEVEWQAFLPVLRKCIEELEDGKGKSE